jgi:phospholipase C
LPNYLGATAGSTFDVADDGAPPSHPINADNLFRQVRAAGGTEKSYEESMPESCALRSTGRYAVKHNPAAYFADPADRAACAADDVAMGTTTSGNLADDVARDRLPTFAFVTPDLCDDTHDCSVARGDAWLRTWMPKILSSPAYLSGSTAVVLVYDESTPVPNVFITPSTPPGARFDGAVDHYALLRATEEMLGIDALLGAAATARDLRPVFNM